MRTHVVCAALILAFTSGCYAFRPSNGGGQTKIPASRAVDPNDVALPAGYRIEPVAQGLTFPTGAAFDEAGKIYVVESGYAYGEVFTTPRLVRIESNGSVTPIATGKNNGPWTGLAFHDGNFFVAEGGVNEGGRILRISKTGDVRALVDGLPSFGDHHTDGPAISPDGWIYFGQGTASNSGVVGEDNAKFGWLKRHPDFHDIPGQDITLVGQTFSSRKSKNKTGAFAAFGTPGQTTVPGAVKCSGGILRVRPDGSDLQLVAWGFRNPFGLAFSPDGQLYVTDNGYDERGSRPIWGAPDLLWRVQTGLWYGWPDYSGNEPVNNGRFTAPFSRRPQFILAHHPNDPPAPVTKFPVHSSADGIDFSRNDRFGHVGDAFVALFGDEAKAVGKILNPSGFRVVRVNVSNGLIDDFAVNKKDNGPASKLKKAGLERPVAVRFNPAGDALYVVDFGILAHTDKAHPQQGTGVLWKITHE